MSFSSFVSGKMLLKKISVCTIKCGGDDYLGTYEIIDGVMTVDDTTFTKLLSDMTATSVRTIYMDESWVWTYNMEVNTITVAICEVPPAATCLTYDETRELHEQVSKLPDDVASKLHMLIRNCGIIHEF